MYKLHTRQGWHVSCGTEKLINAKESEKQTESVSCNLDQSKLKNTAMENILPEKLSLKWIYSLWLICHPALKHKLISGPGGFLV